MQKNLILNCSQIQTPQQLHQALFVALALPDWYGYNLDALFDCLTEPGKDLRLTLEHFPQSADWASGFIRVFADAAQENPLFSYVLVP